ncbi:hypothetical protein [Halofilum ochraceum]|uniref:hypothetical protein n=1 Tax=Halofilum ochraceum TaxID=1611323 RepID=UPI00082A31F9|nr:hypothetical protein [Halofilum ochraceum]
MNAETRNWSHESICLRPRELDAESIAAEVAPRTCRVDFDAPGFCVINVGRDINPVGFRQLMADLKREMAGIHEAASGKTLAYLSAGRFDQQETTRLHLDGGPDECLLMLGYEPSRVDSEMAFADYAKCAFDLGLSPEQFMSEYNPMFGHADDVLRPYTTRVPCFSPRDYRIVCINNSCAAYSDSRPAWQGVLHGATVPAPDASESRVINSTMLASVPAGTPDTVDVSQLTD